MVTEKDELLIESLRSVIDPEIGLNIVELGLIRNVDINEEEETADITMILTTPFCPYGPALIEQVRVAGNTVMTSRPSALTITGLANFRPGTCSTAATSWAV